jgi:hypothetical protein
VPTGTGLRFFIDLRSTFVEQPNNVTTHTVEGDGKHGRIGRQTSDRPS